MYINAADIGSPFNSQCSQLLGHPRISIQRPVYMGHGMGHGVRMTVNEVSSHLHKTYSEHIVNIYSENLTTLLNLLKLPKSHVNVHKTYSFPEFRLACTSRHKSDTLCSTKVVPIIKCTCTVFIDFLIRNEHITSEECKTKNRLKQYCM